jgi:uncharacterized protein
LLFGLSVWSVRLVCPFGLSVWWHSIAVTNWALAWVAISFVIGSFAQSISGFGFTLISVPLISLVVAPSDAVVGQTMAGGLMSIYMAWQLREDRDNEMLRSVIPASLLGMPFGILIAKTVSDRGLRFGVGACVIVAAISIATGYRLRSKNQVLVDRIAGFISGVLVTSTGTNGPPLVIALADKGAPPATFRATLQTAFAVSNVVAIPLFILSGNVTSSGLRIGAIGLIPTVAGRVVGERVFASLDPNRFRRIVLVMLFAAGTVALSKAISG